MYAMRLWATRHARGLEISYAIAERAVLGLDPLWRGIGYDRLARPLAALERWFKGPLFDCRMCGRCALIATGMTCPMNCPKSLSNGPCGGVRENGHCEVKPEMRCVWAEAWRGSQRMRAGRRFGESRGPVDHRLAGTAAWLSLLRERAQARALESQ